MMPNTQIMPTMVEMAMQTMVGSSSKFVRVENTMKDSNHARESPNPRKSQTSHAEWK